MQHLMCENKECDNFSCHGYESNRIRIRCQDCAEPDMIKIIHPAKCERDGSNTTPSFGYESNRIKTRCGKCKEKV